jgi:toxin ParE1/3/4
MPRKIVFRRAAENDLRELYDYIAERGGKSVAGKYIGRIEAACMNLAEFPERGTKRSELVPGLRIIGFERRAAIAFVVEADAVRIMRVLYGGRAFPDDWTGGE